MSNLPKEPISVRIQNFWHSLPPSVQTSMPYVLAALLTAMQQILNGADFNSAAATFVGTLIVIINGFKAVSLTADKHEVKALLEGQIEPSNESTVEIGVGPESKIPEE
jgi:hypothetical protein